VLKKNRPVTVLYSTRFLINWPGQLGGGTGEIDVYGSMVLLPVLSMT